jgi:TIR domain-containing protein/pentapeptide repeat protein
VVDQSHLDRLTRGVQKWNAWRRRCPSVRPDLDGADLPNQDLTDIDLSDASLYGVNFAGVILCGAKLRNADLRFATFTGAGIYRDPLTSLFHPRASGNHALWANLAGADFRDANLYRADLRDADLSDAILSGANLSRTEMGWTALNGTRFASSVLARTVFVQTSLANARHLDTCVFEDRVVLDYQTLLASADVPHSFLRGCGIPNSLIGLLPGLARKASRESCSCFISYSHADVKFARRLTSGLQKRGVRCWVDERDLPAGADILEALNKAIDQHDRVLLCCSKSSLGRAWVDSEIAKALAKERDLMNRSGRKMNVIVPLDLDGFLLDGYEGGPASELRRRSALRFCGWQTNSRVFPKQLNLLVESLAIPEDDST